MGKNTGFCDVLVGLQYGDEGKAKVIDALARSYDVVARFNGGVNAGHTIVTDKGKFALRQIPSAVEYPNTLLYIGSGCVVSAASLVEEIKSISQSGFSIEGRLILSPNATLVLPHHVILDQIHGGHLGTTGNGIGPAYADRAFRMRSGVLSNIRLSQIAASPDDALRIARIHLENLSKDLDDQQRSSGQEMLRAFEHALSILRPLVAKSPQFLAGKVERGGSVLFEGAQSYMLDVVQGDVPYVTSSLTGVGAAYSGGDVPPRYHRKAFGVAKMIMSRVGLGPFPSEFGGEESNRYCSESGGKTHGRDFEKANFDPEQLIRDNSEFKIGQALRMFGGEYGTGSGRPRRVGMLDLPQLKGAALANGIDYLFLTKCDCLRDFAKTNKKTIPVVTEYGPSNQPTVRHYEAFEEDISGARSFEALPNSLQKLVRDIEASTSTQVMGIGNGPHRDQLILLGPSENSATRAPKEA